jgi:hypothetical protein
MWVHPYYIYCIVCESMNNMKWNVAFNWLQFICGWKPIPDMFVVVDVDMKDSTGNKVK